jgi:hypothetical protein
MKKFRTLYGHLVSFMDIWYILCSYSIFTCFGILYQEKSGIPTYLVKQKDGDTNLL